MFNYTLKFCKYNCQFVFDKQKQYQSPEMIECISFYFKNYLNAEEIRIKRWYLCVMD